MAVIVAGERAGVGSAIVGNRRAEEARARVLSHNFQIEIHHALAGDIRRIWAHAVSGVAHRAGESCVDVQRVLAKAGIGKNVGQVVTFGAQRIRAPGSRIGNGGKKVRDCASRSGCWRKSWGDLAELVTALKNMRELRTVRAVGSGASEFAIVVAIVAVRAENAGAHRAPLRMPVQVPHELQQTWLRQRALALLHHRMARGRCNAELRDKVQRVASIASPYWSIAKDLQRLLPRTRPMATQAGLILIDRRVHCSHTVGRAYSDRAILRGTNRCRCKRRGLHRRVRIVAVDAGRVAVILQHHVFLRAVLVASGGKWMTGLSKLGEDIRNRR